jgi:hypothetical protein
MNERARGRRERAPAADRRRRLAVLAAIGVLVIVLALVLENDEPMPLLAGGLPPIGQQGSEPLTYSSDEDGELALRAAFGTSHILFANSPDGVVASAERTAAYRPTVEAVARNTGGDPDLLEAMIFLESAGRPDVIAGGNDASAAAGLAQIVASTGIALLGMKIDLQESQQLTDQIERAERRGNTALALELKAARAQIDERFNPQRGIDAAGRYLRIARQRFGREDLAIASYHMGIGNMENAIRNYVEPADTSGPIGDVVQRAALSYPQIYFDSSPIDNPNTQKFLDSLGDESSDYLWKVLASREVMRLYREDRDLLEHLDELHGNKATAEEVLHPEDDTLSFGDPGDLELARRLQIVVPLTPNAEAGFRVDPAVGTLAEDVDADPSLYRTLHPGALAALNYMASQVRRIAGAGALTVTSGARDRDYQDRLEEQNDQATSNYSLHTTGWSFDVSRAYESPAQARAFQFVLDRMRVLGLIDYAVEPTAIHVTVSPDAAEVLSAGSR